MTVSQREGLLVFSVRCRIFRDGASHTQMTDSHMAHQNVPSDSQMAHSTEYPLFHRALLQKRPVKERIFFASSQTVRWHIRQNILFFIGLFCKRDLYVFCLRVLFAVASVYVRTHECVCERERERERERTRERERQWVRKGEFTR